MAKPELQTINQGPGGRSALPVPVLWEIDLLPHLLHVDHNQILVAISKRIEKDAV